MNSKLVSLAALTLALAACGNGAPTTQSTGAATTAETTQIGSVDEALADAETGRDPAAAQARLETLLGDASLKKEDHARVALALSRIVEKAGDHERAIQLAEDATASGNEDAEKQLFLLLTGKTSPSQWSRRGDQGSPTDSARAFAKYWPAATPDRQVEVEMYLFGGGGSKESVQSPFDVAAALRQNAVDACGLCDEVKTKIHTHSSRETFWTGIPKYASKLDKALVVVYVDAETIPPARYEKWLAAPLADIQAAIGRGDGMVVVKERPGAPPLVTIAAPRMSQLGTMEAKLAGMSTLPLAPFTMKLPEALAAGEIQGAIRARFGAFRKCYEELLARKPGAGGKIELAYAIGNDGTPRDVVVNVPAALDDATLVACVKTTAEKTTYPAWSRDPKATTTVRYPITVTP